MIMPVMWGAAEGSAEGDLREFLSKNQGYILKVPSSWEQKEKAGKWMSLLLSTPLSRAYPLPVQHRKSLANVTICSDLWVTMGQQRCRC